MFELLNVRAVERKAKRSGSGLHPADTYLEPDVVVFLRAGGVKSLSGESVLLAVEIADASLRYDIGRKAALYATFGDRRRRTFDARLPPALP